jgi:hypothetical protein
MSERTWHKAAAAIHYKFTLNVQYSPIRPGL